MDAKTEIVKYIKKPARSLLILHVNPDEDSIGSNLALYEVLTLYGHTVDIVSENKIPLCYSFLKYFEKIRLTNPCKLNFSKYDIFWALDMCDYRRAGKDINFLPSSLKIIQIDHHLQTSDNFASIRYTDNEATATSSLLLDIFTTAQITISPYLANALLMGIIGDTARFYNANVSEKTFEDSKVLISKGADYQKLIFNIYRQMEFEDIQFIAEALQKTKIYKENRCVIVPVPNEIWNKYGKSANKKSYLEKYISCIKDTDFGVIITEKEKGVFYVSFRSRSIDFPVLNIAKKLGGAGHLCASGATIKGKTMEDIIKIILNV